MSGGGERAIGGGFFMAQASPKRSRRNVQSWVRFLSAPIVHVFSPKRAARRVAHGPRGGLAVMMLGGTAVYCITMLLIFAFGTMFDRFGSGASSLVGVWRQWHAHESIGMAEGILFFTALILNGLAVFTAWLFFPFVHGRGPAVRSYRRALCAMVSAIGVLWLETILVGLVITWNQMTPGVEDAIIPISILICVIVLRAWLAAAARGVEARPLRRVPPRCEGCGYDLTTRGLEDVCTECGLPVRMSLVRSETRSGLPWQLERTPISWTQTVLSVLIKPQESYRQLRLRCKSSQSIGFSAYIWATMAVAAGVWIFAAYFLGAPSYRRVTWEDFVFPMLYGIILTILGWVVHRVIAAIVGSWWIYKGEFIDPTWGRAIREYESSFAWVFFFTNGVGFSIGGAFEANQGVFGGIGAQFGVPGGLLLFLIVNGLLLALWVCRFATATRAVRWSNF